MSDPGDRTTARLAAFVVETSFDALPENVVEATKLLILDEIVVTAAAYNTPMARALYRLKGDRGGTPEATLMVDGRRVPAASAAYVHGQLSNLIDADEGMHNRMHTVSAPVLAGLAVAEMTNASGQELITAVATGYDITARVGSALTQYVPDGRGGMMFAPLWGYGWMTLGAAAAAGRLVKLDQAGVASAIGQAHVTTPIYFDIHRNLERLQSERPATWHKYQMSGPMAEAAVNAALLTADGWIAADDVLDDDNGFWKSFAALGCDYDVIYSDLGRRWYITETSIKPYPFCRFGHGALDLLTRMLRDENIALDNVAGVHLRIAPHELSEMLATTVHVDESLKLMMSLPTAMALVLTGVTPGPRWFGADFADPELRRAAELVSYEVVDDWGPILTEQTARDGYFKRLPTEVTVRLGSGREHTAYTEYAAGDPWSDDTAYSFDDVASKAHQYLEDLLPHGQIDSLIQAVASLDSSPDVSGVVRSMVAGMSGS